MRGRDEAGFGDFVRLAAPGLATAAWVLTGDLRTAQGLAEEALQRMYPRWTEVSDRPVATAERELVILYADRRREEAAAPSPTVGSDPEPDPDRDTRRPLDIATALGRLTRVEREVVVLRHYLQRPEDEVVEVLGEDLDAVRASGVRGLRQLAELMREPGDAGPLHEDDVVAEVRRAGADAPPLHVDTEAVLAGGRRRHRRRRSRVAVGALTALAAVAAYVLVSGSVTPEPPTVAAAVPTWDTTRSFEAVVDIRPRPERAEALTLVLERAPGDRAFTVELVDGSRRSDLERVEADLPGEIQLYRGLEHTVALTPVPVGLRPQRVTIVGEAWLAGPHRTLVVEDDGQAVLLHLLPRVGLSDDAIQEILWLADDDTVMAASGQPVAQVDVGVTGGIRAFELPELGLAGIARSELGSPFFLGEAQVGMRVRFGVGVAAGEPVTDELPTLLLTLLPAEAAGARVEAQDVTGAPVPMETAELADHVAAWVVHDADFGRDDSDRLAVTWIGPDGERHPVEDPAADLTLDLHGESYRIDHRDGLLHVLGSGVAEQVPLRPEGGVAPLTAFRRDLALVTAALPQGETVLVPSDRPGPLAQVSRWPHSTGTLGRDGPPLTLVDLTRPGTGVEVEPLAALGLVVDDVRCRLTAPAGLETHEWVFEGGGLRGALLYLPDLDVVAACLGDLAVGGPVQGNLGQSFVMTGGEHALVLRLAARADDETLAPSDEGQVLIALPLDDEVEVHVLGRWP